ERNHQPPGDVSRRVQWADAVQLARQRARERNRPGNSTHYAGDADGDPFFHDQPGDVARLSAERETDADLARAPRDEERQHAVDADAAEQKRESRAADQEA